MKNIIRWGIVGPGIIANRFAEAMKNVGGADLVAVASRSKDKGQEFADKYGIPIVFESYETMAESTEIDAVYIATPHPFHKPCAEIFLNAKKHVLCEKPICVNAKEAVKLFECAQKNSVFLMEAMWTRFLPAITEAVKLVQNGVIGDIRGVSADFCYSIMPDEDPKIFLNDMAGGGLLDVGVYGLNFAAIFLGDDVEHICSVADIDFGVDCQTHVLLKYKNGCVASISSGINVLKPDIGYIYGTDGYIALPKFYGAQEIIISVNGQNNRVEKPSIGAGFEEEIYEVCNCIRSGKQQSDIMPMTESIRILEQMDFIREQIKLRYPYDET